MKIAQDALCEALSINENRLTEIHLYKHPSAHRGHADSSALSFLTSLHTIGHHLALPATRAVAKVKP